MKKIFKYSLQLTSTQTVPMQKGAKILSMKVMGCGLCAWAMVENDSGIPLVSRGITMHRTGEIVSDPDATFIGTAVDGRTSPPLVWHVFDVGEV